MAEPRGLGPRLERRASARRELTPVQADLLRIKKLALITGLYVGATENLKFNEYLPLREEALSVEVEELPVDYLSGQRQSTQVILRENLQPRPAKGVIVVNTNEQFTMPAISEEQAERRVQERTNAYLNNLELAEDLQITVPPDFERPLERLHLRLDTFKGELLEQAEAQLLALRSVVPQDVTIVIDASVAGWARSMVEEAGFKVDVIQQHEGNTGQWGQDVGEFVTYSAANGKRKLGLIHTGAFDVVLNDDGNHRFSYGDLSTNLTFDGGDVQATNRHILVGSTSMIATSLNLAVQGIAVDKTLVERAFSKIFNKPALILGAEQTPAPLFHIDMAVMPVDTNVVAVLDYNWDIQDLQWIETHIGTNTTGAQAIRDARYSAYALDTIQQQLTDAGYEVVLVPTTVEQLLSTQSPVNGLPYTKDGQRHFIMPTFESDPAPAIQALTYHNIIVEPVPNHTYPYRGNLHCLFNIEPAIE